MNLRQKRISFEFSRAGFGLFDILVGLAIAAILGGLSVVIMQRQARDRRLAESKVAMQLLHNRAQQAIKRYQAFEMDNFINSDATIKDCFDAKGISCDTFADAPTFPFAPVFNGAVAGNREDEMNSMMNGSYFYNGRPCTLANCPVRVTTTWEFNCQSTSCTHVTFSTSVIANNANADNSTERGLFASLAPLNSESVYNKTKRIGLVRSLASSCGVPTEANLVTQVMGCDSVAANNSNEVFDSNLGSNYMNGDLRLVAGGTTSGTTTGAPLECPNCTRAVMTDNGLECKPTVLCTDPGKIVRGCKCCNPTIPAGGDGWGAWGACSVACGDGGTQTRTCQFPKKDYCDSVCDEGETQTRNCSGKPYATASWGGWSACSASCGGGTQSQSCAQPSEDYCGSTCSRGQTNSNTCNTQACPPRCENRSSSTFRVPSCSGRNCGSNVNASVTCPSDKPNISNARIDGLNSANKNACSGPNISGRTASVSCRRIQNSGDGNIEVRCCSN